MSPLDTSANAEAAVGLTDWMLPIELLVLLGIANGAPIFATRLFNERLSLPLDCRTIMPDGQPLFGPSKTIRGIVSSVACTTAAAAVLQIGWSTGAKTATFAMVGDLLSSFIKRRFRFKPHAQAFGLDQIPEALLPLLAVRTQFGLTAAQIAVLVLIFVLLEIVLSRVLFRLGIRDRPY